MPYVLPVAMPLAAGAVRDERSQRLSESGCRGQKPKADGPVDCLPEREFGAFAMPQTPAPGADNIHATLLLGRKVRTREVI